MIKQTSDDPFTIPDFLKVANRGKVKPPKAKKTASVDPPPIRDPLADLESSLAATVREELRCGRFREHWLEDPSTVFILQRNLLEKQFKRDERLAKLASLPKPEPKAPLPEFGLDLRIIVLIPNPKRQAGAARIPRFASLLDYLKKSPNASVAEIFKNTTYIKADFLRDVRLKIIKTDLISTKKGK
jgi:hypothetical protein